MYKHRKIISLMLGVAYFIFLISVQGNVLQAKVWNAECIQEGIFLDTVDVGNMTREEAEEAYNNYIHNIGQCTLTLTAPTGEFVVSFEEMGISVDVDAAIEKAFVYGHQGSILHRYKEIHSLEEDCVTIIPEKYVDEEKVLAKLEEASAILNLASKNASVSRVDGQFIVYASATGVYVQKDDTIKAIQARLKEVWNQKDLTMDAVVEITQPDYVEEDFYSMDSILGQSQTEYSTKKLDRAQNLIVGTQKISGTTILPGQQFSVYNTVAPFTEENGYKTAGQYVDNELVDGLGGGVCQVATTLYIAVLRAELQVDERYPHSLTVSYVPKAMDAAIATGYMDFRFTNNTGHPIYIEGYAGGGSVSFAIYGRETRPANRRIEFESKVIETYEPGEAEKIYDDTLAAGTQITDQVAHTGYYAELWKNIYVDGELAESVKVNGSEYQAKPAQIRVGTR